ncbi:uncharacterized protein LY89DRAFT_210230 [Mollisia scopiformis]|uniref:Uncharacterized protein n=1 Tax=Mollisia scopiformis TaxID=149040 RepID=A0A194WX63_MOLSC|nr:uncharacterized protein LY89DRAFT_210230 [Mollisia scopiformis]KUJ12576.1 hypothetical protein LY89DRAFT_210230 [Mollisia scopiformis]
MISSSLGNKDMINAVGDLLGENRDTIEENTTPENVVQEIEAGLASKRVPTERVIQAFQVENPIQPREVKKRLYEHFEDYFRGNCHRRKFAFHERLRHTPNPGLEIVGSGSIGFPLDDDDITKIKAASKSLSTESPISSLRTLWEVPKDMWQTKKSCLAESTQVVRCQSYPRIRN